MDYQTYQERVLARASHRWNNEQLDINDLEEILKEFIRWGNGLDSIKKALMYGKLFQHPDSHGEELKVVHPVPVIAERDQRLVHAMLGVATEGVEMMEAVFAFFFGNQPFDICNLQEEFGDTEWYRAFGLADLGQTHEENLMQNDRKLEARYGSVFSEAAALARDTVAERRILEG